jgi:hypothetical protein
MSLDDAIEEMKRHSESKRFQEIREEQLKKSIENIEKVCMADKFGGWLLVENLIELEVLKGESYHIGCDEIRAKLKENI